MQGRNVLRSRSLMVFLMVLGLMGFAVNPAAARELCRPNGSLALVDGNGDGVVSRGEIQALIDAAGDAEGVGQLQSALNSLPGDVTGIRYTGCTGDGGSGTGNGGTGDGGSGTGDGGTASGAGTTSTGSGTGDGATGDGTASDLTITGLPNTGQGAGAGQGNLASMGFLIGLASLAALLGAFAIRSRARPE